VVIYKVCRPGVSEWCTNRHQARLLLTEYIIAMKELKSTGYVEMYSAVTPTRAQKTTEWVRFLNGHYPLKLRTSIGIKAGVVTSRNMGEQCKPSRRLWDATTHPKPSFAAWIDVMQTDTGFREMVFRAPDPRTLGIAMRVTNYRRAHGVAITPEITRYLWRWVHDASREEG